ncbi:Transforming growth factor beta regulator 1 [Nymphon striatum]|nr:Transforming growth factor beta regulator 1 [Nymphon striatum]
MNEMGFGSIKQGKSTPLPSNNLQKNMNKKYKRKYLMLKKFGNQLLFENAALCDDVAQTQAKILRVKEERKFLLKKVLAIEERLDPSNKPSSPPPTPVSSQDATQPQTPSSAVKSDRPSVKKKSFPKRKKEDNGDPSKPKPKRKKSTANIKKIVQPIPLDNMGRPVFPIVLGGLTVHSIGEIIPDRYKFHDEHYIYPVGYCSTRAYASIRDRDIKCLYTCKISDGTDGPKFEIAADNSPEHCFVGDTASECHTALLNALNEARGRKMVDTVGKGPEFFGFSHPMIQNLIQSCQGARKCPRYQWIKFEIVRSEQAHVTTSELDSDPTLSYEALCRTLLIPHIKEEPMEVSQQDEYKNMSFM